VKFETFVERLETFVDDEWGIQKFLDKRHNGSCPCFSCRHMIERKVLHVWGRCWRVSDNAQDLHVWGSLAKEDLIVIGKLIKKCLDKQKWYNKYTLIIHKEDWKGN